MQVVSIEGEAAQVVFEGTKLEVRLDVCDRRPEVGDYVIVHAGFAIHWIDPEEAKATQAIFRQLGEFQDMMPGGGEGGLS